ncbi:choice-of-anchor L domain-containing protein [Hugenholtzia roseola]|uniref:choice-of-anchor L domain-containing protein n=1 Tax=Hugenholtzia roseola TaxID=1002 RepID=UPI000479C80A|nr:choice-of-anchor L domain-containing protein [Hugenholtzia roseola]
MIKNLTRLTLTLLSCLLWCFSAKVEAQITITQTLTPAEIAQRLQGIGITVTDVRIIRCHPTAQGGFDVTQPLNEIGAINLGNTGIVMASGDIRSSAAIQVGAPATTFLATDLTNPVSPAGTSELGLFPVGTTINLDNDAQLQALSGQVIRDVCHIEIDIIPEGNEIRFPFTFASEEYAEFVNDIFNDAFGFFLSGPNPLGGNYVDLNLAVVPTTTTPVTINTINWGEPGGGRGLSCHQPKLLLP